MGDSGEGAIFHRMSASTIAYKLCLQEYATSGKSADATLDVKTVDLGQARALALRQSGTAFGKVTENKVLSAPGAPTKRHIGKTCRYLLAQRD